MKTYWYLYLQMDFWKYFYPDVVIQAGIAVLSASSSQNSSLSCTNTHMEQQCGLKGAERSFLRTTNVGVSL